jgi:hypothetical protein
MDSTAAKQFLISKVVEQAALEHLPLSEIEKKMLHFTEAHPSLPDIYEVNAEFERDYDSDDYEAKITGLLRRSRERDRKESAVQALQWDDSVEALKAEDHYLLVMVYRAFSEYRKSLLPTHRVRDYAIYIGIGIGVVAVAIGIAVLSH